jgi:hypothetical protein
MIKFTVFGRRLLNGMKTSINWVKKIRLYVIETSK